MRRAAPRRTGAEEQVGRKKLEASGRPERVAWRHGYRAAVNISNQTSDVVDYAGRSRWLPCEEASLRGSYVPGAAVDRSRAQGAGCTPAPAMFE